MANKTRTFRQSFGTSGSQPDLSDVTHAIRGIMFIPVNAEAMEINSNPSNDSWVALGAGKIYNYPVDKADLPYFRGKSQTEDMDIHVEVKLS